MKKKLSLVLAALLLIAALPVMAAGSVQVRLSANPSTARPGDTVTVTVTLSGVAGAGGVAAGGVTITYDAEKLSYQSASIGGGKPATDLDVNATGNTVSLVYLDNAGGSNGFSQDGTMATVRFTVKNVEPGTASFQVAVEGFGDKNANGISAVGSGTSLTIAEPLSTNNALASLTVSNATISPAFNANTTSYTADVPFSVSKLDVKATAADSKAKVSISSPTLTPDGTTNVTITVTAESGAKKTYTIRVHREQDPNYVPSGNNDLSGITVDGFLLSPVFSADVTDYVVWLPYETESVKISGKAADGKASVQVVGGDQLAAGQDNPVQVICTAENGEKKTYTVVVKRAAAHDGSVEELPTTTTTEPTQTTTTAGEVPGSTEPSGNGGIPWWTLLIVGVGCLGGGFAGGFLLKEKFSSKR